MFINWGEPEQAPHRSVVGGTMVGSLRFQKFTCEYGKPHTVSLLVRPWLDRRVIESLHYEHGGILPEVLHVDEERREA